MSSSVRFIYCNEMHNCSIMYAALHPAARAGARVAMALAALSGDEQLVIFSRLCNPLDPGVAVAFSSASSELWGAPAWC